MTGSGAGEFGGVRVTSRKRTCEAKRVGEAQHRPSHDTGSIEGSFTETVPLGEEKT